MVVRNKKTTQTLLNEQQRNNSKGNLFSHIFEQIYETIYSIGYTLMSIFKETIA